jgi:uncharacterized glyoxalase superfamily protein PhnB
MATSNPLGIVSVISLFVEDVAAAKEFYKRVFQVPVVFEDETSCTVKFGNLLVNILVATEGTILVHPAAVGGPDVGKRFQLTIWVDDLDAMVERVVGSGVTLLTGPQTHPWGMKSITFVDPAGHSWEIGQKVQ